MNVSEAMTTDVKFCGPNDSLSKAAQLMWDNNCGCVVVVDEARNAVAMLTDRDVCMAAYTQGKPLHELQVSLPMSHTLWTCSPDDHVSTAERLMQDHQVRRLPVVDSSRRLVGIISLNNLARQAARDRNQKRKAVSDTEIGETLAAICESSETARPPAVVAAA